MADHKKQVLSMNADQQKYHLLTTRFVPLLEKAECSSNTLCIDGYISSLYSFRKDMLGTVVQPMSKTFGFCLRSDMGPKSQVFKQSPTRDVDDSQYIGGIQNL